MNHKQQQQQQQQQQQHQHYQQAASYRNNNINSNSSSGSSSNYNNHSNYNHNNPNNQNHQNRLPLTPNSTTSPPLLATREWPTSKHHNNATTLPPAPPLPPAESEHSPEPPLGDFPQEITWLFFRDNNWVPFESSNHYKIEQAFTLGGIYVDIKDTNFPQLSSIRVFPTRMYLSHLGMKYRLSCVIQG